MESDSSDELFELKGSTVDRKFFELESPATPHNTPEMDCYVCVSDFVDDKTVSSKPKIKGKETITETLLPLGKHAIVKPKESEIHHVLPPKHGKHAVTE
ncbi:uncharacterized protein [Rutidosis leptorrhynchoides]